MPALEVSSPEPQDAEVWSDYLYHLPEGALEFPSGDDLLFGDDPDWSLAIPKCLIEQLWPFVDGAARMLPGRGLEVGGLLVGPKVEGSRVIVDGFIPFPIEYRYGPSFQMSTADLARIAPLIESARLDPLKTIVGFYRSRTRGDEALRSGDYQILDEIERVHPSFSADFRCYFILAPVTEMDALAHIALRDEGPWYQMLPFRLRSNPPAVNPPLTAARNRRLGWRARILLYGLTAIAGLASGYRWSLSKPSLSKQSLPQYGTPPAFGPVGAAAPAHLQFSAKHEGALWKLTWDPASIEALKPVGAILSIEDGGFLQQVPLTEGELASGTLFYTPESSDLSFRLRIDRGGAHVEEHVRVLAAAQVMPKPVLTKTRGKARRFKSPRKGHAAPPAPKTRLEKIASNPSS